jgi:hypothetical protein
MATTSRPAAVARAWAVEAAEVADALGVDLAVGLAGDEAARRLDRYGPNELVERSRKPAWRLLAEQFANTMIVILLLAAAVTVVVGDLKDTAVILAIVVLNALIGFVQENRAEDAMAALKAMAAPTVQVQPAAARRGRRDRRHPAGDRLPSPAAPGVRHRAARPGPAAGGDDRLDHRLRRGGDREVARPPPRPAGR